jgi:transposase
MGTTKGGTRRKHSDEFKAEVLSECRLLGKSISGMALKHGLNANLLRLWLRNSQSSAACHPIVDSEASSAMLESASEQFVAVRLEVPPVPKDLCNKRSTAIQTTIELELRRGNATATVTWPSELASDCGAWLREWLR